VSGFAPAHEVKGSEFFKSVITRNATAIACAYTQAESFVFANLKKLLARFSPWVVLGVIPDLDDFVASKASTVEESESLLENLRAVLRDLPRAVPHEVCYEQLLRFQLLFMSMSIAVFDTADLFPAITTCS
jgi:hypothetical protein